MSGSIRFDQIRDVASISEQTELRGVIRLEQSGVKTSREKRGISERSKNITDRDNICSKREDKRVLRSREEKAVQ